MQKVINIYKPVGYTPYQIVQEFKKRFPEYTNSKIGYAGRLDPMAEGVLVLLVDHENKNKVQFEALDKKYEFEAVLGFATDSYDLLGKVMLNHDLSTDTVTPNEITSQLLSFKGAIKQTYPPFSSVRVKGKPLFHWAFHNKLDSVAIPSRNTVINDIQLISIQNIHIDRLKEEIEQRIALISGNFRQKEILNQWHIFFEAHKGKEFPFIKAKVHCSSGTYIRSLVHSLGIKLNTYATTFSIKRTTVGNFSEETSLHLFKESTK